MHYSVVSVHDFGSHRATSIYPNSPVKLWSEEAREVLPTVSASVCIARSSMSSADESPINGLREAQKMIRDATSLELAITYLGVAYASNRILP